MSTKRGILLEALDAWRAEGALDDDTWRFLRSRYENAPGADELDAPLDHVGRTPPSETSHAATRAPRPKGFAADAMQFVGGLLVGAGLVALVVFFDIAEREAGWAMAALGALLLVPASLGAWRGAPHGLVEAGLAGALVPLSVGAATAMGQDDIVLPLLVAAVTVAITALRRGEGASVLTAAASFTLAMAAATIGQERLLGEEVLPQRWAWLISLLAYAAFLLLWRTRTWVSVTLGLLVAPLAGAFAVILDAMDTLTSVGAELVMGAFLGALLAVGIALRVRGLVAGAAAALTIDALVFAFDVGGPGTAVVVLLALGGLLVWQAQFVRGYFRDRV